MTCLFCNDTGDIGHGYLDCIHCDAASVHAIPGAHERMKNMAPQMRALLAEYLDPVLPDGFRTDAEWKVDFDARVRSVLRRIAPTALPLTARAA